MGDRPISRPVSVQNNAARTIVRAFTICLAEPKPFSLLYIQRPFIISRFLLLCNQHPFIMPRFTVVYESVSKSFRTGPITKYTLTKMNIRWEATQRVMATKLTRLTHKIAIQLHLVAESFTVCSCRSRRPARKLLDTSSYIRSPRRYLSGSCNFINFNFLRRRPRVDSASIATAVYR
jgi:hypothetical protein